MISRSTTWLVVPVLIVAGLSFAWLMSGTFAALFGTAYGWTLLAKLACVSAVLVLAALNKMRFVPALKVG